jgi:ferredoxin-NADP reductase
MATRWYNGVVTEIKPLTNITSQFTLKIYGDEIFNFLPGQFVTFDLPIGEKRLQRWRSYSIANAPDGSNEFEFCIVKSEGGLATNFLFNEIKVGSELKFKGPDGVFVIPQNLMSDEIVMLCTGTGIAPFRSMLLYIDKNQLPFKKIHLIFGTRYSDSILYKDEFDILKSKYSNFNYDIVLSRENVEDYYHGYIHEVYMKKYADVVGDRRFYICGWSGMIDEAMDKLTNTLGYPKSQIRNELYG